jgi:hypothetical protein
MEEISIFNLQGDPIQWETLMVTVTDSLHRFPQSGGTSFIPTAIDRRIPIFRRGLPGEEQVVKCLSLGFSDLVLFVLLLAIAMDLFWKT